MARKIPSRCDELVAVGWRTFTAKGEDGESVRTARNSLRTHCNGKAFCGIISASQKRLNSFQRKLAQVKREKFLREVSETWDASNSGAFPFRGSHKGNLTASPGTVVGIAPFLSPPRNMTEGDKKGYQTNG